MSTIKRSYDRRDQRQTTVTMLRPALIGSSIDRHTVPYVARRVRSLPSTDLNSDWVDWLTDATWRRESPWNRKHAHCRYRDYGPAIVSKSLTSHSTLYRSFRARFLQARLPNQQRQRNEGRQLVFKISLQCTWPLDHIDERKPPKRQEISLESSWRLLVYYGFTSHSTHNGTEHYGIFPWNR